MSDLARGRWPARLNGVLAAMLGLLLSTIGVFLIFLKESGSGDVWINVGGNHIDADVVGIPVLIVGLLIIAVSLFFLRRQPRIH